MVEAVHVEYSDGVWTTLTSTSSQDVGDASIALLRNVQVVAVAASGTSVGDGALLDLRVIVQDVPVTKGVKVISRVVLSAGAQESGEVVMQANVQTPVRAKTDNARTLEPRNEPSSVGGRLLVRTRVLVDLEGLLRKIVLLPDGVKSRL